VTAYVLGYGGFLLLGGWLADLFNRKNLLIGSLVVFVVASIVGDLATSGDVLIGARLAKSIAAAFSAPAALALLLASFDDDDGGERNKALGTFIALSAVGFTAGLILGVCWRPDPGDWSCSYPPGLAVAPVALAGPVIPRQEVRAGDERTSIDVMGALTVTTWLLALVYEVNRAAESGWGDPHARSAGDRRGPPRRVRADPAGAPITPPAAGHPA